MISVALLSSGDETIYNPYEYLEKVVPNLNFARVVPRQ